MSSFCPPFPKKMSSFPPFLRCPPTWHPVLLLFVFLRMGKQWGKHEKITGKSRGFYDKKKVGTLKSDSTSVLAHYARCCGINLTRTKCIITARIRRMGKVIFSLCVSVHTPLLGQQCKYVLRGGRYASCVHTGELSCSKMVFPERLKC